MGGRPSIAFIFVNKQNQQARKTYSCVINVFNMAANVWPSLDNLLPF